MSPESSPVTAAHISGERYLRRSLIATGGMGEVWRAEDSVLHRTVALKVLKPEFAQDPAFVERFATEARNAASLHHPGIASVFDFGTLVEDHTERPFLVMELVEGRALSEMIHGQALPPDRARSLIGQAAAALAVVHRSGLVHRDVKPGNLLVTPEDQVKITDFGIARATDAVPLTQTGEIIGTPHYLSPEQVEGRQATAASDVYALGVVLFECLTGVRPFSAETSIATALAHIREAVPDLPDQVPADLAAVTRRALAKDPSERYADAGEFAAALRIDGPVPLATQVLTMPPVAGRRRPPLVWALALIGLIVLAAIVVVVLTSGDEKSGQPGNPTASTPAAVPKVDVNPAAYVGKPVAEVRAALKALGFVTTQTTRTNTGAQIPGNVAAVTPNGSLAKGSTVAVAFWGPRPAPAAPATKGDGKGNDGKGKGKH